MSSIQRSSANTVSSMQPLVLEADAAMKTAAEEAAIISNNQQALPKKRKFESLQENVEGSSGSQPEAAMKELADLVGKVNNLLYCNFRQNQANANEFFVERKKLITLEKTEVASSSDVKTWLLSITVQADGSCLFKGKSIPYSALKDILQFKKVDFVNEVDPLELVAEMVSMHLAEPSDLQQFWSLLSGYCASDRKRIFRHIIKTHSKFVSWVLRKAQWDIENILPITLREVLNEPATRNLVKELDCLEDQLEEDTLQQLLDLFPIEKLRLTSCEFTPEELSYLLDLPHLKSLDIGNLSCEGSLNPTHLAEIGECIQLESLIINGHPDLLEDEDSLVLLERLVHLQELDLSYSDLTDKQAAGLVKFQQLRDLTVSNYKLTDAGLLYIGQCNQLEELYVLHDANLELGSNPITDVGVAHLRGLKRLRRLSIPGSKITDKGVSHLSELAELRFLALDNASITDAALALLSNLKKLQVLSLEDCPLITDEGLAFLSRLPELQELYFIGCTFTGKGLSVLSNLNDLRLLSLSLSPNITDDGIAALKKLSHLRILYLVDCDKITDASLPHLDAMSSLEKVNIRSEQISKEALHNSEIFKRGAVQE
jgi:hypothetical protein